MIIILKESVTISSSIHKSLIDERISAIKVEVQILSKEGLGDGRFSYTPPGLHNTH